MTPIPAIRPPRPTPEELFRRTISPPADRITPAIGWAITLLAFVLISVVIYWGLS